MTLGSCATQFPGTAQMWPFSTLNWLTSINCNASETNLQEQHSCVRTVLPMKRCGLTRWLPEQPTAATPLTYAPSYWQQPKPNPCPTLTQRKGSLSVSSSRPKQGGVPNAPLV